MKMKLFLLCLALTFLSEKGFANSIDGFDGFKWAATKNEIIEDRGEESIIWGSFEVWQAGKGESVSGFPIKLVGYEFKNGCGAINEARTGPCVLDGGAYILETISTEDITNLIKLLRGKYGKDKRTQDVEEKRQPTDGFLYANIISTRHSWEQSDKSAIELFYKSYDRDHVENLNEVKKGVFRVGVRYYSPGYVKQTVTKDPGDKSF
jgi:hypothetical protein